LAEVEAGNLPVYDPYDEKLLSAVEVQNIYHRVDSVNVMNPDTEDLETQIVRNDLDVEAVKLLRIEQEWYYDQKTKQLKNRLISAIPLIEKYDPSGDLRGVAGLYKIKFE